MQKLRRLVTGLILLVVLVLSLGFLTANNQLVSLELGTYMTQPRPVALWIAAAFVGGGSLGLLVGLRVFKSAVSRMELSRLRAKLAKHEEQERVRANTKVTSG